MLAHLHTGLSDGVLKMLEFLHGSMSPWLGVLPFCGGALAALTHEGAHRSRRCSLFFCVSLFGGVAIATADARGRYR
jgi:hypothetical protein